jgi:adenylate kinase family enzyme/ribosomal protein S18 acetylase RimI-like enzyme
MAERAIIDMQEKHIPQWTIAYPRYAHFKKDCLRDELYVVIRHRQIVGCAVIQDEHETAYKEINTWQSSDSLVMHRVVVDPLFHHQGVATELFTYAKKCAMQQNKTSIKIDTHPKNVRMKGILSKQGFIQRGYLKGINRDAYEWMVSYHMKDNIMKRVVILGASGTGKTTLCRMIAQKYDCEMLHLDSVYWKKDWEHIDKKTFDKIMNQFFINHHQWVIDGNYTNNRHFDLRLKLASTIILLDYGVQASLKGIHKRANEYKHQTRSDMAEGCIEGIDQVFLKYVAFFEQKNNRIKARINQYKKDKNVLIFKNRNELMDWYNRH